MRVIISLIILYGVFAGCTPDSDGTSTETDTRSDTSTTPDTATSSDADASTDAASTNDRECVAACLPSDCRGGLCIDPP
jgi:hypothetical protein